MINDQDVEEITSVVDDINYFGGQHLENGNFRTNQVQPIPQNIESAEVSKYQAFPKFLIVELNKRYDIIPRQGPSRLVNKVTFDLSQKKTVETLPLSPQS